MYTNACMQACKHVHIQYDTYSCQPNMPPHNVETCVVGCWPLSHSCSCIKDARARLPQRPTYMAGSEPRGSGAGFKPMQFAHAAACLGLKPASLSTRVGGGLYAYVWLYVFMHVCLYVLCIYDSWGKDKTTQRACVFLCSMSTRTRPSCGD